MDDNDANDAKILQYGDIWVKISINSLLSISLTCSEYVKKYEV